MIDFIVNPLAGGKNGKVMKKKLALIKNSLKNKNVEYRLHFTEYKRHATLLTENLIKSGATVIVAVGGDGTLHEVINGFSSFDSVAFGIIPCGTGNDFASSINLPQDPVKALDLILTGQPKPTDFMQMPTVRGLNIIGMGLDVEVLKRYENLKKKTKFGYTKCLISSLFSYKCKPFKYSLDGGKEYSLSSFIACIANGNCYGGGIPICPIADPTDKKLDFVSVNEMSKGKLISAFIKLKNGKILSLPQAKHFVAETVKIIPNGDYTVNVDGELYDNIPFEIKIVSGKLRVYR